MMNVSFTGKKGYPLKVKDVRGRTIRLNDALLEDDDAWEDFIDQLNFFRDRYVDGSLKKLYKNIQKNS